jgi:hypothetical protein
VAIDGFEQIAALTLTVVVHVIGAIALIWAMLDRDDRSSGLRGWWPRDDPGDPPPEPGPAPSGDGDRAPLPLSGAAPSPVRLREPGRVGDGYPRPPRRPDHPDRRPARTPERAP